MGIVHDRYKQLKPELRYLSDGAVLAQAWKKSHSYIRTHNWYADTLELDCSAVNLEERIKTWAKQLREQTYAPTCIRMVPAPKSDHWTFYKTKECDKSDACSNTCEGWKWGPKFGEEDRKSVCKELRPLAHLTIQDQTIATAIMLCLADAVETAQGSTESENVWSYGNRLFCDWVGDKAKFRWGNSNTYSKYFQDYQRFLERPAKKAQEIQKSLPSTHGIFEIHLDLEAFYDSIDRGQLIRKLKTIARKHYEADSEQSDLFWDVAEGVVNGWKWLDEDIRLATCLKGGRLTNGQGLPQGMVASGFFANAYLIALDRRFKNIIGERRKDVTLIDYCRYVDDLRLLVHVPIENEPEDWKHWVETEIQELVTRTKGMKLNSDKTKVQRYMAQRSGVSVRMKAIQEAASGPQDTMALDSMQGSLEGLIELAEQFRDHRDLSYRACPIPLAKVGQTQMDVREDTLLRFSVNRLTKALSEKRSFSVVNDGADDGTSELDHVYESFARRFVSIWTRNPSLVSILKKGIQLFPHPQLVRPVFDALLRKINSNCTNTNHIHNHEHERRIAFYCLAEIFRFAALDLHRQLPEERPLHSNFEGLKIYLISKAKELISEPDIPWYVVQQVAIFLAINNEPENIPRLKELKDYRFLHRILKGHRRLGARNPLEKCVPLFVVAFQISNRKHQVISTLGDWIEKLFEHSEHLALEVLRLMAINHPDLFVQLLRLGEQVQLKWENTGEITGRIFGFDQAAFVGKLSELDDRFFSLARIIKRKDNPFAHENALLALGIASLDFLDKHEDIEKTAPHQLEVKCNKWININKAKKEESRLWLQKTEMAQEDSRYDSPVTWLSPEEDSPKLYWLGSLLRACATGDLDFTVGNFLMREELDNAYFGLKTSWYKRRTGMAHQPEAINGAAAPMSSWITELLFRLLQWPGVDIRNNNEEWPEKLTIQNLRGLLLKRLDKQEKIYGKASNLPVYIERIQHNVKADKILRVVMAQLLLPLKEDFSAQGPLLNTYGYRPRHRGHIATIARLICDKLIAAQQVEGAERIKPFTDLIVFPELAVHEDDIGILKQLADKTGAMIFTGLVYRKHDDDLINSALWLIPSQNGFGRQWVMRYQGKKHMTVGEKQLGIKSWRPYQLVIELINTLKGQEHGFRLSGSICYDATDISLAADMKNITNTFIVSALNQDIDTFDTMVDALHYHMYQPVVLVNTGQFGGSAAKAPYKEKYEKQIAHVHGNNQIAISMFELNMYDFAEKLPALGSGKKKKTKPAGLNRG